MCGRYTLSTDLSEIAQHFAASSIGLEHYGPRYNISPTQLAPVVVAADNRRLIKLMRWGLIPAWAKDISIGHKMINARSETVAEKPAYKKAFFSRRCIVPADGFYEWSKVPMHIRSQDKGLLAGLLAFAGLWESWRAPSNEVIESFTIITTEACGNIKAIHDRMPVILRADPSTVEKWLNPKWHEQKSLLEIMSSGATLPLEAYEVSKLVNSPKIDKPECAAPLSLDSA